MGRGRIVNALSFFVFLKNVFLNRHSCYYRIDNLNLRFAFLKFVISATIAITIVRITPSSLVTRLRRKDNTFINNPHLP
jgi:hypothetical protein